MKCQLCKWTVFLLLFAPVACTATDVGNPRITTSRSKGGKIRMQRYALGRFTFEIPVSMTQKGWSQKLRLTQIEEIYWTRGSNTEDIRNKMWSDRVYSIGKMRSPERLQSPVIEQRQFKDVGKWARGIFYYGNWANNREGIWEVLVDYGPVALSLKSDSTLIDRDNVDKVIRNITNITKAYRIGADDGFGAIEPGEWFYLQKGGIKLPYKWEEQSYARFEGHPLDLELEIEMTETHVDEPKEEGLLARTIAAIVTGFASGVDIKRIRSGTKEVAGLKGEEQVVRMKDKDGTQLDFTWRYAGKKDSGEFPKTVVNMQSPDGNLDEKLIIWDEILNSMKPLYNASP